MFRLNTKLNIELSDKERNHIKQVALGYGIDLYGIKIVRNKGLEWRGAVACFSILHPDTIYICHDQKSTLALLPHIAHELCHLKQCENMGKIRYAVISIPILRNWTIEPPAYKIEDMIHDMVTSYPNPSKGL